MIRAENQTLTVFVMIIYKHYGNAEGESYDEALSELDVAWLAERTWAS
jgi:hypothetical protein